VIDVTTYLPRNSLHIYPVIKQPDAIQQPGAIQEPVEPYEPNAKKVKSKMWHANLSDDFTSNTDTLQHWLAVISNQLLQDFLQKITSSSSPAVCCSQQP